MLDRYDNQSVTITTPDGAQLRVEVIGTTSRGATRIGFDGPRSFKIERQEKINQMAKPLDTLPNVPELDDSFGNK